MAQAGRDDQGGRFFLSWPTPLPAAAVREVQPWPTLAKYPRVTAREVITTFDASLAANTCMRETQVACSGTGGHAVQLARSPGRFPNACSLPIQSITQLILQLG